MTLALALYQPDIPQNTGTVLRMCACLGVEAHIIAPAGFPTSDRAFRRAGGGLIESSVMVAAQIAVNSAGGETGRPSA